MAIDNLIQFQPGDGIAAPDLNQNFEDLRVAVNTNETAIDDISDTALRVDGSNVTDATVAAFNRSIVVILGTSGTLNLIDNAEHFLAPTGSCILNLPSVTQNDGYSHTINVAVQGSNYSVSARYNGVTVTKHLLNDLAVDTTAPYNLLYMYNHSDGNWYYYITQ